MLPLKDPDKANFLNPHQLPNQPIGTPGFPLGTDANSWDILSRLIYAGRVSLIVDALDADVMGDEPIWAKVNGKDFGTVGKTHDFGAPRFDKTGKEVRGSTAATGASAVRGLHDGEWSVVGWVTSGGYAHHQKKSIAIGYVPKEIADESDGFEIELLGKRHAARMQPTPLFDANFERMRA